MLHCYECWWAFSILYKLMIVFGNWKRPTITIAGAIGSVQLILEHSCQKCLPSNIVYSMVTDSFVYLLASPWYWYLTYFPVAYEWLNTEDATLCRKLNHRLTEAEYLFGQTSPRWGFQWLLDQVGQCTPSWYLCPVDNTCPLQLSPENRIHMSYSVAHRQHSSLVLGVCHTVQMRREL